MRSPAAQSLRELVAFSGIAAFVAASALTTGAAAQKRAAKDQGEWKAPARAARKVNPRPADAASVEAGRKVYVAECLDCHGARGAGDGPGARDLRAKVPPLTDPAVWRQTDGELFWKVSTGRGDMPGFDDMLEEDERWHVVNYARATFAPRNGAADGDKATAAAQRQRGEGKR